MGWVWLMDQLARRQVHRVDGQCVHACSAEAKVHCSSYVWQKYTKATRPRLHALCGLATSMHAERNTFVSVVCVTHELSMHACSRSNSSGDAWRGKHRLGAVASKL